MPGGVYPPAPSSHPSVTDTILEKSFMLEGSIIALLWNSVLRFTDKQWTTLNEEQNMEAFIK